MSLIRVDKITGKSGTDGSAPIVFSGDTATIGSAVTLPVVMKAVKWGLKSSQFGSQDPLGTGSGHWILQESSNGVHNAPAGFFGSSTLVSHSSGIWSFAETGYYMIWASFLTIYDSGGRSSYNHLRLFTTHNYTSGSTWQNQGEGNQFTYGGGDQTNVPLHTLLKVTDISEQKFKFRSTLQGGSGHYVHAHTTTGETSYFMVLKLGNV